MQQQHEATTIVGSANESRNEVPTNPELKLDNNISSPLPRIAPSKSNVVSVVASYGAIDSLR